MCDPISASIAGAAVLGAGSSYLSGRKAAKTQKAAQAAATSQAAAQAQQAEQQYNRANQKQPALAALFNSNRRSVGKGVGSTFLTGTSGVKTMPLGGGPSLLGA